MVVKNFKMCRVHPSITSTCPIWKISNAKNFSRDVQVLVQGALKAAIIFKWEPISQSRFKNLNQYSYKLGMAIISIKQMQNLNGTYGAEKKSVPTDILSFPCQFDETFCRHAIEDPKFNDDKEIDLGDIFLCPEWILRKYRICPTASYGHQILLGRAMGYRVLLKLLVHGIVHLLGLDHYRTASETIQMRRIEKAALCYFLVVSNKTGYFRSRSLPSLQQRFNWGYLHRSSAKF